MAKSQFISTGSYGITDKGWVINEPVIYHSELIGRRVKVNRGFFSDLASVPKIVPRFIVDVATGKNRLAAIVHDALCTPVYKKRIGISQAMSDLIFRECMKVCGVARWRANIMYTAVFTYQLFKHRSRYWSVP